MFKILKMRFRLSGQEKVFLLLVYAAGVALRLLPRLAIDPHLLTMNADVWERVAMAQYFLDHGQLPLNCLRYSAFAQVPFWYPPIGPLVLAGLSSLSGLDVPTVCSRLVPCIEAAAALPFFFLARWMFGPVVAMISTIVLALTPAFVYWTGIATPATATVFLLPVGLMFLLLRGEIKATASNRTAWVILLGAILTVDFLTHLTYFLFAAVLILAAIALYWGKRGGRQSLGDLFAALLVSQVFTVWWWWPRDLYSWWLFRLTTSSGFQPAAHQLADYGIASGIIGLGALAAFFFFRSTFAARYRYLLLVWLALPLLESQNETILRLFGRTELSWSNFFKPVEGFRFYCFLAQPLALITGLALIRLVSDRAAGYRARWQVFRLLFALILSADLLFVYDIGMRFRNSGITVGEYKAAVWFRSHSGPDSRIVADYYRSQMFAGVSGGKALLGGLFPIRGVRIPYISVPATVQDDLCDMYATSDADAAAAILAKYNSTHVFIGPQEAGYGFMGSARCPGFGFRIEEGKFSGGRFRQVYADGEGNRIVEMVHP